MQVNRGSIGDQDGSSTEEIKGELCPIGRIMVTGGRSAAKGRAQKQAIVSGECSNKAQPGNRGKYKDSDRECD